MEYKPGMTPPTTTPAPPTTGMDTASCPYTRVTQQGDLVRKLKAEQAPKVPESLSCYFSHPCPFVHSPFTSTSFFPLSIFVPIHPS